MTETHQQKNSVDSAHGYRIVKGTHALVTVERDNRKTVIDPGVFSSDEELDRALQGADLLLITHIHPDHADIERLAPRITAAGQITVLAPAPVIEALEAAGAPCGQLIPADGSQTHELAGFSVREVGGQHALIHVLIPVEKNVGYVIDGAIFHPGDCLAIPPVDDDGGRLKLLLVPTFTPWARHSEVADFAAAVGAERSRPIHDGPLTAQGSEYSTTILNNVLKNYGTQWEHWTPGDTLHL